MKRTETLLLTRADIAQLLTIDECIMAVEHAFKLHAEGKALPPKVLGMHTEGGGFHIKAGILDLPEKYFVAKTNANFPANKKLDLPTIQGLVVVCDGKDGRLLAIMDSIEITIIRTGAATAVAAKYLAATDARTITICGCGNQGRISLQALMKVRQLEKVFAFDIDKQQAEKFALDFTYDIEVIPISKNELSNAIKQSHICVTCTPSKQPFIRSEDLMPGTFIAAVGADSENKQEIFADVLASSKVVVDLAEQSAGIGEVHHAIEQNKMSITGIHAELGMIIAGQRPGRESDTEIIVFDSTGTALQDVAAATIVYKKAVANGIGIKMNFTE